MNKVRAQIGKNIMDAMYEANMSDISEGEGVNDLPYYSCHDSNLYGTLRTALEQLGYGDEYQQWLETGDRPKFE